ncbi:hypothetical protein N7520_000199 [Penicillium odoratum]|uniref:uncharacterized protein n=1 Tax=Penicillium odoratum TaxID=1167516 RepID=UPI0025469173|nr:uncharacterized protein N7520_000199 [Penicillium odoratum]KAJ5776953.1 hypothetical protein N7520_000199 [Penicillium odoratum]
MDPEYVNFILLVAILFSCSFTILYWRLWEKFPCSNSLPEHECLPRFINSCSRYTRHPRRACDAIYKRTCAIPYIEIFPVEDVPNSEDGDGNQLMCDQDAYIVEFQTRANTDIGILPTEHVSREAVAENVTSASASYSGHYLPQTKALVPSSPVLFSADPQESVTSSDESIVMLQLGDSVDIAADYLIGLFDENAISSPAE